MATKTEIINLIELNLADESDIPAELHREVELKLVDEIFSPVNIDSNVAPVTVFQGLIPGSEYEIMCKKVGNIVTGQGFFLKSSTLIEPNTPIFKIIDTNFLPLVNKVQTFIGNVRNTGTSPYVFSIQPATGEIHFYGSTARALSVTVYFSFSYFTNNI